jgi:hypothetical protein
MSNLAQTVIAAPDIAIVAEGANGIFQTREIGELIRSNIAFSDDQNEEFQENRSILDIQIKQIERQYTRNGNEWTYENQINEARKIKDLIYNNRKIMNISFIYPTQAGKTGVICSLIKEISIDMTCTPIDHIFIITCLNDLDWVTQTKERLPKCFHDRIFHRPDLKDKFVNMIRGLKDVLIIIDENFHGAGAKNTTAQVFRELNLLHKESFANDDIKILEIAATHDGCLEDLRDYWKENGRIMVGETGHGYWGTINWEHCHHVKQYHDLCGVTRNGDTTGRQSVIDHISNQIKTDVDSFLGPKYILIRVPTFGDQPFIVEENFKEVFGIEDYEYESYDGTTRCSDIFMGDDGKSNINNMLINEPFKHTFIFIKEMLRCSKTLIKTHIGICYDRWTQNPNDTTVLQAFLGRLTGYDVPNDVILYTNIDVIEKYNIMLQRIREGNYNFSWRSITTKTIKRGGEITTKSKGTMNNLNVVANPNNRMRITVTWRQVRHPNTDEELSFHTFTELKRFWQTLKDDPNQNVITIKPTDRGPREGSFKRVHQDTTELTTEENNSGVPYFYAKKDRGQLIILSPNDITPQFMSGRNNNDYRIYALYNDKTDPTTLEWRMYVPHRT